jgi:hypothetical protein
VGEEFLDGVQVDPPAGRQHRGVDVAEPLQGYKLLWEAGAFLDLVYAFVNIGASPSFPARKQIRAPGAFMVE